MPIQLIHRKIRIYVENRRCTKPVRVIFLILFALLLSRLAASEAKHPIALQPFGKIDKKLLEGLTKDIPGIFCKAVVHLQEAVSLPVSAYYPPRKRYRAEKLLDYLQTYNAVKMKYKYLKVIGLTAADISTTKGEYEDWGIFGLAYVDTGPCIISTFRLKRGVKSEQHFKERLLKVIIHELGHAYGLLHCTTEGCVMQDARGTIKTVDSGTCRFCPRCREKLWRVLCR